MDIHNTEHTFLASFFSDETERFRTPAEPVPGQKVTVRLRGPKSVNGAKVTLALGDSTEIIMRRNDYGQHFSLYEATFTCPEGVVSYRFRIEYRRRVYICQKDGTKQLRAGECIDTHLDFRFFPGFHTPRWARGAVQYQIFPDRFRNGDKSNDVEDGEYSYNHQHVRRIADWDKPPAEDDYRCFYGGDLRGIMDKLDYLQDLGVEVIYLNPIFLSPSSHKYDTQDYEHVDPHFGVIEEDHDLPLEHSEMHNGFARKYISRVLSEVNATKTDALFAEFCAELHKRGMRVILDGVFNHCGSFHLWMDREGIYKEKPGYAPGAYQSEDSPYRDFFHFTDKAPGYEAWWGVDTLPKLYYENSRNLWEAVFSIAEKWLKPPYSIDGWRLDVAADLGHSLELNHAFWREFRNRVKAVNPEAVIIAEHYGNPETWLEGDQWDTVMNYDAFMDPVSFFLTGMEKHSDGIREDLYQDGEQFFATMQKRMASFQWNSLQCAMNELSNHDHSRFLTRTNRTVGRTHTLGPEAAEKGIDKAVLREAVVIQMTWPGAPTIYYGDEAGLVGWTDPDNRRGYPWGREDTELIDLHRSLIALRHDLPVLRTGSIVRLGAGHGWISYSRFDGEQCIVVVCNNGLEECTMSLDVWKADAADGDRFVQIFRTDQEGHSCKELPSGEVRHGKLYLSVMPQSTLILRRA